MNLKSSNKDDKSKKGKKKIYKKVTEALPFLNITKDYIKLKDSEFLDILEIEGKDIFSLNPTELNRDISVFHSFYKVTNTDLKIVSLNFPVETVVQRNYLQYKISRTSNIIYKEFLNDKIKELKYLEDHRTNKEYYLFIYALNLQLLSNARESAIRILSNSVNIKTLSLKKKELILFKLNNKTEKITGGDNLNV